MREGESGERGGLICEHAVVEQRTGEWFISVSSGSIPAGVAPRKRNAPGTSSRTAEKSSDAIEGSAASIARSAPSSPAIVPSARSAHASSLTVTGYTVRNETLARQPCAAAIPSARAGSSASSVALLRSERMRIVAPSEAVSGIALMISLPASFVTERTIGSDVGKRRVANACRARTSCATAGTGSIA